MGNPWIGPRWLAITRHESAFRHLETAAVATSVRHQSYTRGEAEVPARRAQEIEQRRALFNAETGTETTYLCLVSKIIHKRFQL